MKNKPGKQTDSVVFLRAKFHAKLFTRSDLVSLATDL